MASFAEAVKTSFRRLLLAGGASGVLGSSVASAHVSLAQASKGVVDLSGSGVSNISFATYAANDSIEDRFFVRSLATSPTEKKVVAAVLDGHGGWQASEFAHRELPKVIGSELANAGESDDAEQVARALIRAFSRTDREFMDAIRGAFKLGFGEVAKVGCCALAAVITPKSVVVANAGDCRAVYGQIIPSDAAQQHSAALQLGLSDSKGKRRKSIGAGNPNSPAKKDNVGGLLSSQSSGYGSDSGSGSNSDQDDEINLEGGAVFGLPIRMKGRDYKLWAVPLSHDHNARIPREVARLAAEHPNEADIVKCHSETACYVKGRLQPTRALGDAYLKHSEFNCPSPMDVLATFFSPEERSTGEGGAKARNVLANGKIKQLTEGSGFALSGESFYPDNTVGSASIAYGNLDADAKLVKPNTEAAAASASAFAKKMGRHIPAPYTPPYITATPETTILKLGPATASAAATSAAAASAPASPNMHPDIDFSFTALPPSLATNPGVQRFVVLGCDGLWDVLSNEEVVHFLANDGGDRTTVASRLVHHVLEREAEKAGLTVNELMRLPPGRKRRGLHDDVTAVVLWLGESGAQGEQQLDGKKKGWLW